MDNILDLIKLISEYGDAEYQVGLAKGEGAGTVKIYEKATKRNIKLEELQKHLIRISKEMLNNEKSI